MSVKKISQREARKLRAQVAELQYLLRVERERLYTAPRSVSLGTVTLSESVGWLSGRIEGSLLCGHKVIVKHCGYVAGQSAKLEFIAIPPRSQS